MTYEYETRRTVSVNAQTKFMFLKTVNLFVRSCSLPTTGQWLEEWLALTIGQEVSKPVCFHGSYAG